MRYIKHFIPETDCSNLWYVTKDQIKLLDYIKNNPLLNVQFTLRSHLVYCSVKNLYFGKVSVDDNVYYSLISYNKIMDMHVFFVYYYRRVFRCFTIFLWFNNEFSETYFRIYN